MNGLEKIKKHPILICLIALLLLIVIPFCINLLFKYHTISLLEWEDDAGAMLEFYGAVLGGGITLLVLWITTDETRRIQGENKQQLEDEKKEREREKRKAFADSVIDDFAKFCADSSSFKESQELILKCKTEIKELDDELQTKRTELEAEYKKMTAHGRIAIPQIERLKLEEKSLEDKIEYKRRNIEAVFSSRKTAQERYLVLKIKLDGIEGADQIIQMMNQLLVLGRTDSVNFDYYHKEHLKTIKEMTDFIKKYIEG